MICERAQRRREAQRRASCGESRAARQVIGCELEGEPARGHGRSRCAHGAARSGVPPRAWSEERAFWVLRRYGPWVRPSELPPLRFGVVDGRLRCIAARDALGADSRRARCGCSAEARICCTLRGGAVLRARVLRTGREAAAARGAAAAAARGRLAGRWRCAAQSVQGRAALRGRCGRCGGLLQAARRGAQRRRCVARSSVADTLRSRAMPRREPNRETSPLTLPLRCRAPQPRR